MDNLVSVENHDSNCSFPILHSIYARLHLPKNSLSTLVNVKKFSLNILFRAIEIKGRLPNGKLFNKALSKLNKRDLGDLM